MISSLSNKKSAPQIEVRKFFIKQSLSITNSRVLCVVSVGITTRINEPVRRIVGEGKGAVREHIAVKVITYSISVERDQPVVGIIPEAAVRCRGYITCCIVVEGLGRYHRVIAELLDSSRSDSTEIIIIRSNQNPKSSSQPDNCCNPYGK